MSSPPLMDSAISSSRTENLAVAGASALQSQDKTALKKTFQRGREGSQTKMKERKKTISHITRGVRMQKKVSLDNEDEEGEEVRSAAVAGGSRETKKDGSTCLYAWKRAWLKSRCKLMQEETRYLARSMQGKLINQISERFVNAPCSYQEANYHYQLPLFVSGIIRLITKLSPLETRFSVFVRTKPLLSSNDTVSVMEPISICAA